MSKSSSNHYIVAIGASAGGLEAIHEFFDNMPQSKALSFIIIQHLSPDYKSLLVELIAKHTHMQVMEAAHDKEVLENTVYVIPNNKLLTIKNGRLQLEVKSTDKVPNTAVDIFLRSLAVDQQSKAIAIILSGTGTDGSKGIVEIHKHDGLVMVQDPVTAKFDGMPNSAIATGVVDNIMAPELMPEELFNYINEQPKRISIEGRPDETDLPEVMQLIEKQCGQDFSNYKSATILRRISKRMSFLNYETFREYLNLLRSSPEECGFLSKEFLIGVTRFFRDPVAYTILKNEVLIPLVKKKEENEIIKLWVTACSTGEEAYSIAILLNDVLESLNKTNEVKIFASDIDAEAIEFASKGSYSEDALKEVDSDLVGKYFKKTGTQYTVIPSIRKQIVFARHNILKDPPFIKNDLVSCRNMLIYMNAILQRRVVSTLQFALNTGAYLFLGPSESPITPNSGFDEISTKWKIYRKNKQQHNYSPDRFPVQDGKKKKTDAKMPAQKSPAKNELQESFKDILVSKFGFAAIYIDQQFEIKEATGDYKKYLSLPDRLTSLNLLKMVDKNLSGKLNLAIRKCLKDNQEVTLKTAVDSGEKEISIFIQPPNDSGLIMLIINEEPEGVTYSNAEQMPALNDAESMAYISGLEDELKETRLNLQISIESLETTNEELQSSNEELLSANEELQSSNEELQSLNEELHTLNTEHQLRIRELIELNDDLNNYFSSSDIAQIFIDGTFRIRKFNPVALKLINLIESDIGRPIQHISTNIIDSKDFTEDILRVVSTRMPVEKEVRLLNGTIHLMKIYPYIRQDKRVDGAVISFVDISNIKELNSIIHSIFNATISAIMAFKTIRDDEGAVKGLSLITTNSTADDLLTYAHADLTQKSASILFPQLFTNAFLEKSIEAINTGQSFHLETSLTLRTEKEWYEIIAAPMSDGLVVSMTNISEKKKSEEKLRRNYQELIKAKENFRNLNLQLEQKVRERTEQLSISEERFRLITASISDAVWDRDLVNDQIWWSDGFYKWFDFNRNEDTNSIDFWLSHVHPDDKDRVMHTITQAINCGKEYSVQYHFLNARKEYIPVIDKGIVLTDENGVPYRLLGAMTDRRSEELADQNRALKAFNAELEELVATRTKDLENQKNILQNLFMQAPALICTFKGPDHVYELVNPQYQKLFGQRELKGKPIMVALPELEGQSIKALLDRVYTTGESYIGKEVYVKLARDVDMDVEEMYINLIYQPTYDENDAINGILVFAYEVTQQVTARKAIQQANDELLKLNQEFQVMMDFMPQMVWVSQPDGDHIYFNKVWYEYTGLTPDESDINGWMNALHPEDRERTQITWRNSIQTGNPYEIEYRIYGPEQGYRWFLGRALPIMNEEGLIEKWFGTCTDIQDQKVMNDILEHKVLERTRELQRINSELELSNSELTQFASVASHDLQEPLRKILLFSHLVKDRVADLPGVAVAHIDKIIASSSRMSVLVHDLLSYTKLASMDGSFEATDLNTIINEVQSDLELIIQEKKAVITRHNLPVIDVLAGQMRQVFQNIISNSLKFSKAGIPPQISISAERVSELSTSAAPDAEGWYYRIVIQDNGIGFSNEYAEKIFTLFQRLHTRTRYEGTGIGLSIAKKIISQHNGIIKASGEEKVGARFTIVLPAVQKVN